MDDLTNYDRFAGIYDRLWAQTSCDRFLPIIRELVLARLQPGATVLDLCCGTGAMSRAIHSSGFRPIGVDGAAGMITLARAHAPQLELLVQSCVELKLTSRCQAAICLYDSLNHLRSLEELEETLRRVYASIDVGPFLFDLNGEEGYRKRWRGSFSVVKDDVVVVVRSNYDDGKQQGLMNVTTFTLAEQAWQRNDLSFEQRLFDTETVLAVLQRVGFTKLQTFDAVADLGMRGEAGRIVFLCEKA
jgi:SAM-dependent methyltransferase